MGWKGVIVYGTSPRDDVPYDVLGFGRRGQRRPLENEAAKAWQNLAPGPQWLGLSRITFSFCFWLV
jgi:hypothetical protein